MRVYYNEFDAKAAAWLRELIKAGHISDGEVDERSICDVQASDLMGFDRCHFFAGIGGWELALQLSGVPASLPCWTGSCPCQPFSSAGKQKGVEDKRHLWPVFRDLIRKCKPPVVFGEQVASAIGHGWLDGVFADLEAQDYSCGAIVLGAHSIGSPHIRQRLYWLADSNGERRAGQRVLLRTQKGRRGQEEVLEITGCYENGGVVNTKHAKRGSGYEEVRDSSRGAGSGRTGDCLPVGLGNAEDRGCGERGDAPQPRNCGHAIGAGGSGSSGLADTECDGGGANEPRRGSQGRAFDWWTRYSTILCRDNKLRRIPVEPAFFPLADGIPARVVRLRGYGNAIVPQVAAAFIEAWSQS